jgi:hypothetical protein
LQLNTSFVHGYNGILLGLIMIDNEANQVIVMQDLAEHPKSKAMLIEAMEEFAQLHEHHARPDGDNIEGDRSVPGEDGEDDGEVMQRPRLGDSRIAPRIRTLLNWLQQ